MLTQLTGSELGTVSSWQYQPHTTHRTHHALQYYPVCSLHPCDCSHPLPHARMFVGLHVIAGLCLAVAYTLTLHAFLNPIDTQDTTP